jgi:hypothetical protein
LTLRTNSKNFGRAGYVGALSASICVKFIEDDEIEIVSITRNGLIESILPDHKQLQHHEIGEKNIGTELLDSFSLSCPVYRSKVGRSTCGSPD